MNVKVQEDIDYDDRSHRYSYKNTEYISVTQLLSKFKPKFDTGKVSESMVEKYGKDKRYWVEKWDEILRVSLVRGNQIHNRMDMSAQKMAPMHYRNLSLISQDKVPDGIYPEKMVYSHQHRIAGRMDLAIIRSCASTLKTFADIQDYKTNRILYTSAFRDKHGNPKMLLYPLNHIEDCHMNIYALQLSLYQYLLELCGYEPGVREIIHIKHEIEGLGAPPPAIHSVPYLRNEVIAMLKYWENELRFNTKLSHLCNQKEQSYM